MKVVDHILLFVATLSPLVGVIWFGWEVDEVIFIYIIEAAIITVSQILVGIKTRQQITHPDIRTGYTTSFVLRMCTEGVIVLGGMALFVDAIVGSTILFEHLDIIGGYLWQTLIPVVSLLLHYGQRFRKPITPTQILPVGWWILYYPFPLFVCAYVLAAQAEAYLLGLLIVVISLKAIAEFRLMRPLPNLPEPPPSGPVLTDHPYGTWNLLRPGIVYLLIMVGFLSVNPFTQDPTYTVTQNMLIFFGFCLMWLPWLRRSRVSLQYTPDAIIYTQQRWLKRQRSVAIADITKIGVSRNSRTNQIGVWIFHLKKGRPLKLGPWFCLRQDFLAWLRLLQQEHPAILKLCSGKSLAV